MLDRGRRIQYQLSFLDSLVQAGTPPEVAYDSSRIEASIVELGNLMGGLQAPKVRAHVERTIERLQELSKDPGLEAAYALALAALRPETPSAVGPLEPDPASGTGTVAFVGGTPESHQ
jgi:hypothetical protein